MFHHNVAEYVHKCILEEFWLMGAECEQFARLLWCVRLHVY